MAKSNLVAHAEHELRRLEDGLTGEDLEWQRHVSKGALGLVRMFAKQGHSGFSAAYMLGLITKLMDYKPLTPLTGEDDEWHEVEPGTWQNKRCSRVFKDTSGAYDIEGIVWEDSDGFTFTNFASRVPVSFPYFPKTEHRFAE